MSLQDRAIRPQRGLPYHQLITIKTFDAAVTAIEFRRYELITDACLQYRKELLESDPQALDLIQIIRNITKSFIIARANDTLGRVSMVWQFSPEDYEKFVKPWASKVTIDWVKDQRSSDESDYARQEEGLSDDDRFFIFAFGYTYRTYDALRLEFQRWADPIIADFQRMIEDMIGSLNKAIIESVMVKNK